MSLTWPDSQEPWFLLSLLGTYTTGPASWYLQGLHRARRHNLEVPRSQVPILFSWGSHTKYHKQRSILSQFWRLEVQNVICRPTLALKDLGKNPSLPLLTFCWLLTILQVSMVCGCITPISVFVVTCSFHCVLVFVFPLLLGKTVTHLDSPWLIMILS